jgi:hypothetical protein
MSTITTYPLDPAYGVTADGRVFRLERLGAWPPGECKQHLAKRGYYVVCVRGALTLVHRMVALTFLPNPGGKRVVAHNNGRRTDNRVENLRWATAKENNDDKVEHGTLMYGDAHVQRKLSLAEVREIRAQVVGKPPRRRPYHRDLAEQYGVTRECISRIAREENWARAIAS